MGHRSPRRRESVAPLDPVLASLLLKEKRAEMLEKLRLEAFDHAVKQIAARDGLRGWAIKPWKDTLRDERLKKGITVKEKI